MTLKKVAIISGTAIVYAITAYILFFAPVKSDPATIDLIPTAPKVELAKNIGIIYPFGIKSDDSLNHFRSKIQRNDTFYTLLREFDVTPAQIQRITKTIRKEVDLRSLKIKQPYHIFFSNDSLNNPIPRYFVIEKSYRDYTAIKLTDSVYVRNGSKPSEYFEEIVGGEITSTLYESLIDLDEDPNIAYRLSDLFAWQIDFYRIQKGDEFKILMEKEYIDGKPTGDVIIKAAYFEHKGEPFYAFRYQDNNRLLTLDEQGNSLQKTFLRAPVRYTRVSSKYTKRRFHPVLKRYRAHLGTDYVAPRGTPVYATADGVVIASSYTSGNGNYVKIKHNGTYKTAYLHLSKIANNIKRGTNIRQGQVIGYVGSTGLASGDHVCYRFWKNDIQVDPFKQSNPPAEPIEAELRKQFFAYMMPLKQTLDQFDSKNSSKDEQLALF